MPAFLADVNMVLPDDHLIDLFLFQLYSPDPVENGAPAKLPQDLSERRSELLTRFHHWLRNSYVPQNPFRLYFVLLPELSVSLDHVDTLRLITQAGQGTAGVLAGLEFLRWDEYSDLVSNMPDMPDHPSWTANGEPTHMVNSALILLNENDGRLRRFVQPKRNPSDGEAATHFHSQNVLFFRSNNQAQGRRLNFGVQICSDFTDHTQVSHLRREFESVCDGRPIDFTFLLQRNPDQFAPQFRQSVRAYFDPPEQISSGVRVKGQSKPAPEGWWIMLSKACFKCIP